MNNIVNNLNTNKINKRTNINAKKNRIQRNKKIVAITILLISLFIIGTSLKNMYVSYRCSDFIYAVDYYFTNWKDKNLRLIKVESIAVVSKIDNTIEIEASGFSYNKPYKETCLIGTFTENNKGNWFMKSVKIKDDNSDIKIDDNSSLDNFSIDNPSE